jgi:pimeloyl-[acyl-carrier protein] synthase
MNASFDPESDAFLADPYAVWAEMRRAGPIHKSPLGFHVVPRYAEVAALLRDPRLLKGPVAQAIATRYGAEIPSSATFSLFDQDPPDHTRLRALLSRPFTADATAPRRASIERTVEQLLSKLDELDAFDVMADLAYPLQTSVIAEFLGVPAHHCAQLQQWGLDIALGLEVVVRLPDWDTARVALRARRAAADYFTRLIEQRRVRPADDLISQLLVAEVNGDRLTLEELIATCVLLLVAGHETTVNLIGNGVNALLANPEQAAMLRAGVGSAASAVDELLRYDAPGQATVRVAATDIMVGDVTVAAGEMVLLAIGSANRDEQRFERADTLDVTRTNNRHLAFGSGIHACIGAPLARLVGEIAFTALASRLAKLRVQGSPQRRRSLLVRGFLSLPVARQAESLTSTNVK